MRLTSETALKSLIEKLDTVDNKWMVRFLFFFSVLIKTLIHIDNAIPYVHTIPHARECEEMQFQRLYIEICAPDVEMWLHFRVAFIFGVFEDVRGLRSQEVNLHERQSISTD